MLQNVHWPGKKKRTDGSQVQDLVTPVKKLSFSSESGKPNAKDCKLRRVDKSKNAAPPPSHDPALWQDDDSELNDTQLPSPLPTLQDVENEQRQQQHGDNTTPKGAAQKAADGKKRKDVTVKADMTTTSKKTQTKSIKAITGSNDASAGKTEQAEQHDTMQDKKEAVTGKKNKTEKKAAAEAAAAAKDSSASLEQHKVTTKQASDLHNNKGPVASRPTRAESKATKPAAKQSENAGAEGGGTGQGSSKDKNRPAAAGGNDASKKAGANTEVAKQKQEPQAEAPADKAKAQKPKERSKADAKSAAPAKQEEAGENDKVAALLRADTQEMEAKEKEKYEQQVKMRAYKARKARFYRSLESLGPKPACVLTTHIASAPVGLVQPKVREARSHCGKLLEKPEAAARLGLAFSTGVGIPIKYACSMDCFPLNRLGFVGA